MRRKEFVQPLSPLDGWSLNGAGRLNQFTTKPEQLSANLGWVFAANTANIEPASAVRFKLYKKQKNGDRQEITDHEILSASEKKSTPASRRKDRVGARIAEFEALRARVGKATEQVSSLRSKFEALGELAATSRKLVELQDEVDRLAAEARRLGASWGDIGEAAGIRAQSAQQRWDPAAKAKHAERQRNRFRSG